MSNLVPVTIDGKKIEVPYDTTVLDAAKKLGIFIPTLCHNENVKPYGVCRICLVEMRQGKRSKLVPSCVFPLRKETEIQTNSAKVQRVRKWILQLMLARSPNEKVICDLAAKYGVEKTHPRFSPHWKEETGDRYIDESSCILCGQCVRVCEEIVGVGAIAFEGRGAHRRVTTPFDVQSNVCIACGACEYVCPTKCIGFVDHGATRELKRWHMNTKMIACSKCGDYFLPEPLAKLYEEKMNLPAEIYQICPNCRDSVFK